MSVQNKYLVPGVRRDRTNSIERIRTANRAAAERDRGRVGSDDPRSVQKVPKARQPTSTSSPVRSAAATRCTGYSTAPNSSRCGNAASTSAAVDAQASSFRAGNRGWTPGSTGANSTTRPWPSISPSYATPAAPRRAPRWRSPRRASARSSPGNPLPPRPSGRPGCCRRLPAARREPAGAGSRGRSGSRTWRPCAPPASGRGGAGAGSSPREVALERGRVNAVSAGLLFMAGMRQRGERVALGRRSSNRLTATRTQRVKLITEPRLSDASLAVVAPTETASGPPSTTAATWSTPRSAPTPAAPTPASLCHLRRVARRRPLKRCAGFPDGFGGVGLHHQGPVCWTAAGGQRILSYVSPPIRPPKVRHNGGSMDRLPDVRVNDHKLAGRCVQDADGDLRDQARERPRPPARPAVQHMQSSLENPVRFAPVSAGSTASRSWRWEPGAWIRRVPQL